MKIKKFQAFALYSLFSVSLASHASIVTYDNEAALIASTGTIVSYDFETTSGFVNNGYIGNFDNINFDATTFSSSPTLPGTQSLTGASGTRSSATIDFSAYDSRVLGVGFDGLDLIADKIIRVSVDFNTTGMQVFDISLGANAEPFSPVYFAAYDSDDFIRSINIYGTDSTSRVQPWLIDNLSLVTSPMVVPVPAALPLFLAGLGFMGMRFRHKRQ
ncbi:MAG: VPLPA-CTERM sorting domain-containing protein [Gammaproteobacteria bacterium]|nr:VPLPA-CTERM sorting domain-containing protein [Gammaproteobacteria bacterium]